MLSEKSNLNQILLEFESTLCIDYSDRDTHRIIDNAIHRLENNFGITINKSLYDLQIEQGLVSNNIEILLSQIEKDLKDISLYIQMALFTRSIPIHLGDVNYLGVAKPKLISALKYLQDDKLYEKRENTIMFITSALSNLEIDAIKRLFVILLILEKLGVCEGVAIIANLLYLGGI